MQQSSLCAIKFMSKG